MKYTIKSLMLYLTYIGCFYSLSLQAQYADFATFEIGEATLPAYTTTATEATPFTTIDFDGEFENPPNVFVITPQFAGDPCMVRIDTVTETGFDATCLEPLSEDRDNPGTTFEYIAIVDGGITVPLSDGSGSVVFESECQNISTEQWGNACPACSGTESFTPITFTTSFSSAPAVLAQVQTTNNDNGDASAPTGEPAFIGTAIGDDPSSSVTASGFNLSIERMEAGEVGSLSSSESICYLAAETSTTCQSLDFSSIGGPSTAVMFQALIGTQNVEGQNTSGSTTSFAAGCFTSTPLALATHITRNGNDGGWLRRVSVNTSGVTLIFDEDTVGNNERNHNGDEQPAIMAFGQAFTTPVSLSSARVSVIGRYATFNWDTTAETFNLGFNLWGETDNGWVQLNRNLIAGSAVDTDQPQAYRETIHLARDYSEITQFGISSVDSTGYEEFFGPFSEGQDYGDEAINEAVDWTATRDAFQQSMHNRGFIQENNRWRRPHKSVTQRQLALDQSVVDISVEVSGIHSISGHDLITVNPQWKNLRYDRLALTLNGQPVPRHIISEDNRLDASDLIIFNAREVAGDDTPFLEHYTYRLSINKANVQDLSLIHI